ncbi:proteasome assembly chaperone family protein [Sulfuracidifex metallicus]|uniref:proteasome assembly chaperone family protein n=1 Tax=Sulfuracidifex metallicus TaxID=47303 RepID=UPI002275166D|nr:PAC2 family protein [Sulfuracidifex metallicus]MCY0850814.1 PAC2 family protein [Sulfuracidifex metallicus]
MKTKIILKKVDPRSLRESVFITGFRTIGEVGYLATRHLVLKLGMRRIGFVTTPRYKDVAFLDEYGVATPFELFFDDKNKIIVQLNHFLPSQREWADFVKTTIKWMKEIGVKDSIAIGGLDKRYRTGQESFRWLKTTTSKVELDSPMIEKQLLMVGPLALYTAYSEIEDFPATILLPYAERDITDPAAAAVAIETINQIYSINVDVNELYEEARKIEEDIKRQLEAFQKESGRGKSTDRLYM